MKNPFKLCLCCCYNKTEKTQSTPNNNNNNNIHVSCTFDDAILSRTVDTSSTSITYDSRYDSKYDSSSNLST